jgi:hypothetical protein
MSRAFLRHQMEQPTATSDVTDQELMPLTFEEFFLEQRDAMYRALWLVTFVPPPLHEPTLG